MRKILFTMVAFAAMATSAFAQTEQGKIYVGASSNLKFENVKPDGVDGVNYFNLDAIGGYFIIDNLSINAKVGFGLDIMPGDLDNTTKFGLGIGARYYFPPKVFLGAMFDFNSTKTGDADAASDPGIALQVGYAIFLNENISIEPALGYRLGLGDKEKGMKYNTFGVNIGFGIYF